MLGSPCLRTAYTASHPGSPLLPWPEQDPGGCPLGPATSGSTGTEATEPESVTHTQTPVPPTGGASEAGPQMAGDSTDPSLPSPGLAPHLELREAGRQGGQPVVEEVQVLEVDQAAKVCWQLLQLVLAEVQLHQMREAAEIRLGPERRGRLAWGLCSPAVELSSPLGGLSPVP